MSRKSLAITLGILVIVIVVIVLIVQNGASGNITASPGAAADTTTTAQTTPVSAAAPSGSYTLAQVATHNNASSCWTAINGNVYDVTTWINQHPGGRAPILSLCGTDGSAAFNGQHGGQARPAAELATFKIGTLAQ